MSLPIYAGEFMIREYRMDDAPAIARYANNRNIWKNLRDGFPHPYILDDAVHFIKAAHMKRPATYFAIATEKEAIGGIGLTLGQDVHRFSAELGYWLAEPFWGKGIMTRAVTLLTEYAIPAFKLNRIFAEPYTTNEASARVLEKSGYEREGVLRSHAFKNKKILDQYMYSYVPVRL